MNGAPGAKEHTMNTITIHGNLTRDIELATASNGTKYVRFSVASNRGSKSESTDFFRCAAFGDWVSALADLPKGTWVKVTGSVRLGTYDNKPTCEVVARKVEPRAREEAA
jgi:single-stranded DNA-binding protein